MSGGGVLSPAGSRGRSASGFVLQIACNLLTRASVIPAAYTFAVSHSPGRIIWGVKPFSPTVENHAYNTRQAVSRCVFGSRMPSTTYKNTFPLLPGYS